MISYAIPHQGRKPVDVNLYATKKTVAQGMMDLALLTANANQLRYVLEAGEYGNKGVYYHVSIVLISLSIIFQVRLFIYLYSDKDKVLMKNMIVRMAVLK